MGASKYDADGLYQVLSQNVKTVRTAEKCLDLRRSLRMFNYPTSGYQGFFDERSGKAESELET